MAQAAWLLPAACTQLPMKLVLDHDSSTGRRGASTPFGAAVRLPSFWGLCARRRHGGGRGAASCIWASVLFFCGGDLRQQMPDTRQVDGQVLAQVGLTAIMMAGPSSRHPLRGRLGVGFLSGRLTQLRLGAKLESQVGTRRGDSSVPYAGGR
ncbi:hypothetical protein B0J13DRAFT_520080 [Dactylonectria estremocensis]|uniref:Uncharacterized protein n=1 Tax=Dactylonectria estremocensis TaxID=1079267 RepID=A0A9P9J9G7_9HYPO|nr:hypothetical protein B0J13DRAFT_520080 [Dactylonectria estremocensis]